MVDQTSSDLNSKMVDESQTSNDLNSKIVSESQTSSDLNSKMVVESQTSNDWNSKTVDEHQTETLSDTDTRSVSFMGDESPYEASSDLDSDTSEQQRNRGLITIRLRDGEYLIHKNVFKNIPGSRLHKTIKCLPTSKRTIYFDRPSHLFEYILDAYQNDVFHVPHNICGEVLTEELEFWKVPMENIAHCCLKSYSEYLEKVKIMEEVKEMFSDETSNFKKKESASEVTVNSGDSCAPKGQTNGSVVINERDGGHWKRKINVFLEDPFSSPVALAWGCVFLTLVITSATVEFLSSDARFRSNSTRYNESSDNNSCEPPNRKLEMYLTTEPHVVLKYLQLVCLTVFTVELLVRFITCENKKRFFTNVYNVIDLLALIPMAVLETLQLILGSHELYEPDHSLFQLVILLSVMGVFKTLRLVKITRRYSAMNIVLLVIRSSVQEMVLLLLLMSIGILIFSILIYYAEFDTPEAFNHIAIGFWWSIVTMTTVGYGDTHPTTPLGYVTGALCAISGILFAGLLIPILSSKFNRYYSLGKAYRYKQTLELTGQTQQQHRRRPRSNRLFVRTVNSIKM